LYHAGMGSSKRAARDCGILEARIRDLEAHGLQ